MTDMMRAVVLDAPGPPESLTIREVAVPEPAPGWVLIRVKAFGLNRSELHTRLGLAEGVEFPRVLGIEATGEVARCPGGEFEVGQQVMAMMGGMGRIFDGGYADFTCVPAGQVVPFRSNLDWAVLGALPEMLQTSYGSLTIGLDAAKAQALTELGVDHVLVDDGQIADRVREIRPDGVDTALELIGTPTLPDTLRATRVHGVVCFTGMLSNQWIVEQFYPIDYLPRGVRLTAYGGDANDLPHHVLDEFLAAVAAGTAIVPIDHIYRFDQIVEAHTAMESGHTTGKLVVTT